MAGAAGKADRRRAAAALGKTRGIGRDDLLRLGEGQGVRKVGGTIDRVVDAVNDWPRWAEEAGLGRLRSRQIGEDLAGLGW